MSKKRLNPTEISTFCSQTGWLINTGMTPVDAMSVLMSDSASEEGKDLYNELFQICKKGVLFSHAMKECGVFPDYCIQLISLGEASGNLDDCLQALANYYEKEEELRHSLKNAISYPLVMICMMFVVIYVLMSQVLPIFRQVFEELGSEINGLAASLLNLGTTLNRYTWLFVIILVLLFLLYEGCTRIPFMKRLTHRFLNWFPLTKEFMEQYAYQRFASGMAMTLYSGIDTYQSLDLLAEITDNKRLRNKIMSCKEELQKGASFAEVLTKAGIFSKLHTRMVSIGFRSGNIDAVMNKIADSYEKETERKMHALISILEPTLVIILSIIVGLVLLSVILPLMGIMSSIG